MGGGGTPGMARIPQLDLCISSVAKIVVVKFQKDLLKEHVSTDGHWLQHIHTMIQGTG